MNARARLAWLEQELERDDLTDLQFDSYNNEANAIQAGLNTQKEKDRIIRELARREVQEDIEMEKILSLTEEEVDKMYADSCLKYQDINGLSFKEWYEQSIKYYTVDINHNVHAKARSSDTVEIVPHPTLAQAKYTILKRIKYKFYDHAVRGHDFAYEFSGGKDGKA